MIILGTFQFVKDIFYIALANLNATKIEDFVL